MSLSLNQIRLQNITETPVSLARILFYFIFILFYFTSTSSYLGSRMGGVSVTRASVTVSLKVWGGTIQHYGIPMDQKNGG